MLLEIEDRCIQIDRPEKWVWYGDGDSAASLVYLVSLFMVTVHVWQSTTRDPERPDFLLVDLDPPDDCTIGQLARTALRVREFFSELHVDNALVKSSGARGLHIVVPVAPEHDYKTVRALSAVLARRLAHQYPGQFTAERDPRKRPRGSVYVDWGQVGRGMTIVPPFAPRACEGAPVSMPLKKSGDPWSDRRSISLNPLIEAARI